MAKESYYMRKKREKMEGIINDSKGVLKGKGKLTTSQQNKLLLGDITKRREEETEAIAEKGITHRTFRCSCGYTVSIEGTLAGDLSITKCSKCSKA